MFELSPLPAGSPEALLAAAGERMRRQGFAVLDALQLASMCGYAPQALASLQPLWDDLPADGYLLDGGHYRRRRHASLVLDLERAAQQLVPQRAHYQPTSYNSLHGGLVRWYEALDPSLTAAPAWQLLVSGLGRLFASLHPTRQWFVEAHQFRIDTSDGVGRPTPEGAHRDGVDFVAVLLVQRHAIRGGETRVFEQDGPLGVRFTLAQPWSVLLLDDTRVVHESTPIMPLQHDAAGWRDTLVLTWRSGGFMDPPA